MQILCYVACVLMLIFLNSQVQDAFPFSISLAWKGSAPELDEGEHAEAQTSKVIFPRGNSVPSIKIVTFYRSSTFNIDVLYTEMHDLPPGTSQKISTFTVCIVCFVMD